MKKTPKQGQKAPLDSHVSRLVALSALFRGATTIERLSWLRGQVRAEVKSMPRDSQQWLLDEWTSCKRRIEMPGISDEEWEKLKKKVK